MEKNIITILVEQHRELQKNLKCIIDQLEIENPDSSKINKCLSGFSTNLAKHLELENDSFYKDLLKVMEDKGQDTTKTRQFITEMKDIEVVVMDFLKKFENEEKINEGIDDFKKELVVVIETLSLRIETEEAGVYAYWGLF